MNKFSESSGLGISLEATVGHHFIRSVLPEGPVGRCGKLYSGDELLEVRINFSYTSAFLKDILRDFFTFNIFLAWNPVQSLTYSNNSEQNFH